MTSSPDPRPDPRRRLTSDELIAMFVAFLSIGGIFLWATSQKDAGFDFGSLSGSLVPGASQTAPAPVLPSPQPSPNSAIVGIPAPPQAGLPSPQIEATSAPQPNVQAFVPTNPAPIVAVPDSNLPNVVPAPTKPITGFSDVPSDFWAGAYIGELSRRNILGGYQDGTFKPNDPITRAQFASLLGKAFGKPKVRETASFQDVPDSYWAKSSIDDATQTGFMSGYAEGLFRPDQQIPLYQLQVALATGLKLQPQAPAAQTLAKFEDTSELPKWSQDKVAAAVEAGLVTGFPSAQKLTPNRVATRADAAALIYQSLVKEGRIPTK